MEIVDHVFIRNVLPNTTMMDMIQRRDENESITIIMNYVIAAVRGNAVTIYNI
jgi:hypothetical protein